MWYPMRMLGGGPQALAKLGDDPSLVLNCDFTTPKFSCCIVGDWCPGTHFRPTQTLP